ncbi:MAG: hypothetical protein Q8O67_27645 [Deltaproteobacteria bacterium]|nr:hypothetical protein [Deltaproteobacteria bacterium]
MTPSRPVALAFAVAAAAVACEPTPPLVIEAPVAQAEPVAPPPEPIAPEPVAPPVVDVGPTQTVEVAPVIRTRPTLRPQGKGGDVRRADLNEVKKWAKAKD